MTHQLISGIAIDLLDADSAALEPTALKLRNICRSELEVIAVTGCVPGQSQIRAILLLAGSLLRLDTQEVEGLNSTIKTCVARSQNNRISLQLLSARVCMRKVIALNTNGSSRVKDIKPFAAQLSRRAFLFYNGHQALLCDDQRWRPTTSQSLSMTLPRADPAVYDPQKQNNTSIEGATWAMKYHAKFMKAFKPFWRARDKTPNQMLALVIPSATRPSVGVLYIGCAVANSQVVMAKLKQLESGSYIMSEFQFEESQIESESDDAELFQRSLAIIAGLHSLVEERKSSKQHLKLQTQHLELQSSQQNVKSGYVFQCVGRKKHVCDLRPRYARKKRKHNALQGPSQPVDSEDLSQAQLSQVPNDKDIAMGLLPDQADHASPDSDWDECDGDVDDFDDKNDIDKEALIRRMIFEWDDDNDAGDGAESDSSDLCEDDKADLDRLEELNGELAAACANQLATKSEDVVVKIADKVQSRCETTEFQSSTGSLPDSEQQQEALLQEVLSGGLWQAGKDNDDELAGAAAKQSVGPVTVTDRMVSDFQEDVSQTMEAFLQSWQAGLIDSINALVFRKENKNQAVNKELSLILHVQDESADVLLVQWSASHFNQGREIHLDEDNRIICPVNFLQRARTFDDGVHLILPCVGEMVRRVRKADRPYLPKPALQLMKLFKQSVLCHGRETEKSIVFDDEQSDIACAVCHSTDLRDTGMRSCALCGLTTHNACNGVVKSKCTKAQMACMSAGEKATQCCIDIIPHILLSTTQSEQVGSAMETPWSSLLEPVHTRLCCLACALFV